MYICQSQSPSSSHHPLSPLGIHTFVLHICVNIKHLNQDRVFACSLTLRYCVTGIVVSHQPEASRSPRPAHPPLVGLWGLTMVCKQMGQCGAFYRVMVFDCRGVSEPDWHQRAREQPSPGWISQLRMPRSLCFACCCTASVHSLSS